jgi:hypothetical protein
MKEQQLRRIVREELQRLNEGAANEITDFLSRNGERVGAGEFLYDDLRFVLDGMDGLSTFVTVRDGGRSLGHAKIEDGMIYMTTSDSRQAMSTSPVGEYAGARNLINALVQRLG